MVKAIVGANWGDEGKGKITDVMAAQSDVAATLAIPLSIIMANSLCISFLRGYFTAISRIL